MADLPQLPERVRRKLALQWDALVEKHGFTGEHLNWPETRRREIVTEASRPPIDIHSQTVRYVQKRTGPPGPVYAHPDTVGISESGQLAMERFTQLIGYYFFLWAVEQGRRSEIFTAWLVELRSVVVDEVGQLWKERGDWFQRVCRASIATGLTPMFDQLRRTARAMEIADLEPENIPFEEIMARDREAVEGASKVREAEHDNSRSEQPPETLPARNKPILEQPPSTATVLSQSILGGPADSPESIIDDFCTQKGWSLDLLAEKAGIDRRQVFKVRNGRPVRPYVRTALGNLLGVEPRRLLPKGRT